MRLRSNSVTKPRMSNDREGRIAAFEYLTLMGKQMTIIITVKSLMENYNLYLCKLFF